MGYTTEFSGVFKTDRPVDEETYNLLIGLAETRRMARKVDLKYGVEGEFYIDGDGFAEQERENNIIDCNKPPKTQPSLWCQWHIQPDHQTIVWDGNEKFYNYVEWIEYLIERILKPRGYKVAGQVKWQGEDIDDRGIITIVNNEIEVEELE